VWFAKVKETYGDNLQIDWQPFILAQANSKEGPEWKAWEQPEDNANLGLLAMRAGEAARRQGSQAFEDFQLALLKARHEDRKDLSNPEVIMDAAQTGGLDMARFREDLADESILKDLAESHTRAVDEYGVFGVPTFIFPDGTSAFVKAYVPPEEDAVQMFEDLADVMGKWRHIGEVKRPQPPWPKGVFT
jgi:hypothetical protein